MKRALVVYESMYGNTQRIAQAIADGLSTHLEVGVTEVGTAPQTLPPVVELLVIGGPTHAFGMTRPSTRQSAAERATGPLVSTGIGQREWLERAQLPPGVNAATFDTKVGKPRFFWGSAAKRAAKALARRGAHVLAAQSFYVTLGPPERALEPGEEERARAWGEKLGADFVGTHPRLAPPVAA
ncbi:MAG: flavodoxin domain-containing protein [Myxococcota bacterium]